MISAERFNGDEDDHQETKGDHGADDGSLALRLGNFIQFQRKYVADHGCHDHERAREVHLEEPPS